MSKRNMPPFTVHHVYSRGVMKMNIFRQDSDYWRFLKKFNEYNRNLGVGVLVYCLMPNHFHLLLQEPELIVDDGAQFLVSGTIISRLMQLTLMSHAKYYGLKYKHSGSVFQGKFKSKIITDEAYLSQVVKYILDNPVRKGYVKSARDWKYSGANYDLINKVLKNNND